MQGRGCERRCRIAVGLFAFDVCHRKFLRFDFGLGGERLFFRIDVELFEFFAVKHDQPRFDQRLFGGKQFGVDRPVFFGFEVLDFDFPLTDQAKRNRLYPAGGFRPRQLAPQNRRQVEAYQIVERAPRHIGGNQIVVNLTRVFDGFGYRRFGDFVKDDAFYFFVFDFAAGFQFFQNVPGNRFSFPVRVGGEDNGVGVFNRRDDVV